MTRRTLALLLACAAACVTKVVAFECTMDGQCSFGTCEATGYCSVADPACPTGRRYVAEAGDLANRCVGEEPIDAPAPGDAARDVDGQGETYPCSMCATVGGTCDPSGVCAIPLTDQGPHTIACPPGHYCHISCAGNGCRQGLTCTGDFCRIDCTGDDACRENLVCSATVCVVACDGANSCTVGFDCRDSTLCVCCQRTATCAPPDCPPGGCDPGPACD